jgi:hypothetical protein
MCELRELAAPRFFMPPDEGGNLGTEISTKFTAAKFVEGGGSFV